MLLDDSSPFVFVSLLPIPLGLICMKCSLYRSLKVLWIFLPIFFFYYLNVITYNPIVIFMYYLRCVNVWKCVPCKVQSDRCTGGEINK